ncbi:LytR/AlgR family response regulator transcription factor [Marinoscillum sp.]|uniref:LytR/AlgR family response regulator transcription factor n=1 Tax=Marinoscillum sp. TaxID=2024838 RepID=UPI003BAAF7A4
MTKPSILVVEDEPLIADDIADTLTKNGYRVVAIVDEGADALQAMEDYKPDLAILDVNIEGEMDGIELAPKLGIPFIFLTSYYDKATLDRAKVLHPAGYIVKPFSERDLIANVALALHKVPQPVAVKTHREKLFVKKDQEIISVMSDQILFAEAFDNYAYLYTESEKYIISHTLKSIEEKLVPLGFLRVHRSYLINFDQIDSISEGYVFLKGHKIQIGKSYRKEFMDRLSLL